MKKVPLIILLCMFIATTSVFANPKYDFSLHKMESGKAGKTILVITGIQGNEPGGFNAASILTTHYKIKSGNVWVVPNLNFISIIKRTRGVYGDLNRKFASLKKTDPEYATVQKIKSIILDKKVDLVLNLHDGSGFYRPTYVDKWHNPDRWGQSLIIDQERIDSKKFGNLGEIARQVVAGANKRIFKKEYHYHVYNTKTVEGNEEMLKSLTYFAISNKKPAFGLEASKKFLTHERIYFHLNMIDQFMAQLGIQYDRSFKLTFKNTRKAYKNNVRLALYDHRIFLDVTNGRDKLAYVPLKKNATVEFTPSNPLIAIVDHGDTYRIHYGNNRLSYIQPEYFEYDSSIRHVNMQIDGEKRKVGFGNMVQVAKAFKILPYKGYRVNIIGFQRKGHRDDAGAKIRKASLDKEHSVDKKGLIYRVEVYRQNKFSGMVLVNFGRQPADWLASNSMKLSMLSDQ